MDLKGTSFQPDKPKTAKNILCSVEGRGGAGKSDWACGAPGPILFMDLDFNSDPVRQKFLDKGKEIWYAKYNIPGMTRHLKPAGSKGAFSGAYVTAAVNTWAKFQADYYKGLGQARTIIIDTATAAWELCRLAHFLPEWGRIEKIKNHHYTPLNSDFRNLLTAGYESDCNVILTHKVKKLYQGDSWNGKWERAGFGDIEFACQVNVVTLFDSRTHEFKLQILKCTQNPLLVGEVLEAPMNTFAAVAQMVFSDTEAKTWKSND